MSRVGILFPLRPHRAPAPPSGSAFGRAALVLADEGIDVVVGREVRQGRLWGQGVRDGRWEAVEGVPVTAFYHRFPDGDHPKDWQVVRDGCGARPIVNAPDLVALCRDKWRSQHHLTNRGIAMPEVVHAPGDFASALRAWGAAFLKPRFGAFGEGVQRIEGTLPDLDTEIPWVLQRAVPPPLGWAAVSVRVLVQRAQNASWVVCPGAARRSRRDPVANHARGAEVFPADDVLPQRTTSRLRRHAHDVAEALADHPWGHHLVEVGLDYVIDPQHQPHLIEVNGKPRGKLSALAARAPERFADLAQDAVLRPLRVAARLGAA